MQTTTDNHNRRAGRVLVLGTDERVVLAAVRSLGRQGLTVHLGWCKPNSIATRSRYVSRVHEIAPYSPDDDRWRMQLREILEQERFDLVIPCNDSTLVPLAANRDFFMECPEIYLLPDRVFSIVSDKFKTFQLALAHQVEVPRGDIIDGSANPDHLIEQFGLPLVLKPQATFTVNNSGLANVVRRVHTRQELADALQKQGSQQALVQENFTGRGVGIEMLVHDGRVLFAFQHRRIHETMEWGSSYRESAEITLPLLDAAKRLMQAIRYTGVAMAEFIVDPSSDRSAFLEINGRFWGSLPLAVEAGADFPYFLYQMLVEGKRDFASQYRYGVRCRNLPLDLAWMKSHHAATGWRKLLVPFMMVSEISSMVLCGDHLDSFSIDDPLPQVAELYEFVDRARSNLFGISISPKSGQTGSAAANTPMSLSS